MKNILSSGLILALMAGCCLAADANAGSGGGADKDNSKADKAARKSSSSSVKEEKPFPRIWIGLTGSFTPRKLLKPTDQVNQNTGEEIFSTNANGQLGGGAIVNYRFFRGYWLSVGAIYRFTGYDATDNVNDLNGTVNIERTRVRLVDIPVMLRYSGRRFNISKYTFYEVGAVARKAFDLQTTTNSVDGVTGELGPIPASGVIVKNTVYGLIAGAGVHARDDFGIIVSPEVRYTHWMGNSLTSNLIGTQRDQLEVTVSFGF